MSITLSKLEKRTAYTLLLPAVCLVFAIVLFPILANIWISFKEVGLKDIRIPEPRAKKIVKSFKENNSELKIIYKLLKIYLYKKPAEKDFFHYQLKGLANPLLFYPSIYEYFYLSYFHKS